MVPILITHSLKCQVVYILFAIRQPELLLQHHFLQKYPKQPVCCKLKDDCTYVSIIQQVSYRLNAGQWRVNFLSSNYSLSNEAYLG